MASTFNGGHTMDAPKARYSKFFDTDKDDQDKADARVSFFHELQDKGTPFGSRPLGVASKFSDYDYAISEDDFRDLAKKYPILKDELQSHARDTTNYSKVEPEHGFVTLIHKFNTGEIENPTVSMITVDILVCKSDEDIDIIRSTIADLCRVPTYMLQEKRIRIELYQLGLSERGWTEPSRQNLRARAARESAIRETAQAQVNPRTAMLREERDLQDSMTRLIDAQRATIQEGLETFGTVRYTGNQVRGAISDQNLVMAAARHSIDRTVEF